MTNNVSRNSGSFRDPANCVYEVKSNTSRSIDKILRGVDEQALSYFKKIINEPLFQGYRDDGRLIKTQLVDSSDPLAQFVLKDGWHACLEHEVIPFISYPYEWTFSMLKDAALLQLDLLETCLENQWTLKDASPYNIQWFGSRPTFIDEPSFEPWIEGESWVGYRQFCSSFLTPLLIKAHLGIDYIPLMRSWIDGIPPIEAAKYFTGRNKFKKGVLSHVIFPAKVEARIIQRERDQAPARKRIANNQSKAMVVGLIQSMARLISKLTINIEHTDWSNYDRTHSYASNHFDEKKQFVTKHIASKRRGCVWDIGCNTGTFSRIASKHSDCVVSFDGDHDAIEKLYLTEKKIPQSNILPLVINLANISPGQGWAGKERQALDNRRKPDLVMCLALIHHVRITANIPNKLFLSWLRSLDAEVIIEFVNRDDEMVVKLLTNKKEQYDDYNCKQFIKELLEFFEIKDHAILKNGKREIFLLIPK